MNKALNGLGAVVVLALACALAPGPASADDPGSVRSFRLLQLDGYYVKWGDHALGSGARVSYAFVTEAMTFEGARNCAGLVPMDGLTARSGISRSTLEAEAAAAFRVWEEAADIRFVPAEDPSRADILIGAQAVPRGYAFANVAYRPGSENGIKVIEQALICFNPARRWKVGLDGNTDVYDIRYTLIHEIGHAIGLDHPSPTGQLMSFRYSEDFRDLQSGDLRGVAVLYGDGARFAQVGEPALEPPDARDRASATAPDAGTVRSEHSLR